jgi:glycosyltransferase involved in cell wall biosynthesis
VKVALDAQLTVGTATGIGEYVRGLADALRRRALEVIELRDPALDPWRFDRRVLWDQVILPRRARSSGAQLLHCTAGTMPGVLKIPIVVTVHDLAWHEVQAHAPAYARYYFGPFSLRRYRRAARIIVDSSFSRNVLLPMLRDFDPGRVDVVYPGVAADFCRVTRSPSDGRTILAVGTVERRKNLEVLIRALAHLPDARLVAIGPHTPYARECVQIAEGLNVADRVAMPGYVPREELVALYECCAVAAVPSRYEGFGYAAAQALCAGVPCVVSDRTSLPEITRGDATIVDADDAAAWACALSGALRGSDDAGAALARAGAIARFSWEASAERIERIYATSIDW